MDRISNEILANDGEFYELRAHLAQSAVDVPDVEQECFVAYLERVDDSLERVCL
jgi:hypothetical protein